MFSCQPDYIYDEASAIPNNAWSQNNPVTYKVNIQDTLARYNLYFDIEHSKEYAYQNMYVQIHTTFPSGEKTSSPLSIDFMNKSGMWYGKCNSETCKLRAYLKSGVKFREAGEYRFEFEQYMRDEQLKGIKNLGFLVQAAEK